MMPRPSDNSAATPRAHISVCTCPDLNVTTWLDLQKGQHTFAKGWTSDCPTHGYEGTNPSYRKVVLSATETPRTWALPVIPEDVQAVHDREGVVWHRAVQPLHWETYEGTPPLVDEIVTEAEIWARGPLTEVQP